MGKGQRTKGNTKPSSSRRTAELLGTSGSGSDAVNTFIGFSSLSSNVAEDEDIDTDFKVVFKKMSKKDCVTKVKALQEFQRLINDKTDTSLKTVLAQWPRIYNKLAIDNDWRVREATHKSHEQLIIKVGRNIAPHLKQLMPIWLTSQYDPYTPAANAAAACFETAFPASKKAEVLLFTKTSVFNYIKDMLLNQTIESVSEETSTPEENKSKYNRLVSNCLQGLSSLIVSLPTDSLSQIETNVQELVNSNKFWKLAKFPDSAIRSSWFRLLSTFAQYLPQIFNSNANKICGLTLGGLDENDFLVAASVWECALITVITIEDCWKFVNFRKAFYPQLRGILREGGRGNASIIFPNLLPLLSRIPLETSDNFIEFHKEFYVFLREGLGKTVSKSQSESNAIINAYMECLRFSISSTFIEDIEQRKQFQLHLIQNELLSLVNDSISANDSLSKTSLFNDLALLWLYLRKEDKYENLIKQISDRLTEICLSKISENCFKSFGRISRLFLNLFCDSIAQKKDKKIRFRRDSDKDDHKLLKNLKFNDLITDKMAVNSLNKIALKLIDSYNSNQNYYQFLELLIDILRVYNKDIFDELLKSLDLNNFDQFWTLYVKEWFKKCRLVIESDENFKQIKLLIDLIAVLLGFVEEKQRKYSLLNEILSLNDPFLSEPLFSTIIQSKDKCLTEWLKCESTGISIVLMTSKLIEDIIETSSATTQQDLDILWKLISHCFADNSFDRLYIEKVIEKFRISLQNSCRSFSKPEFMVEFTCRLASQLFSSYELCTSLASARELLLTIFSINCRFDDQNKQLLNAWKTGVTNIVKSNGGYLSEDGIITKLILQIKSRLQSNITSIESAELVYTSGLELINTIYDTINSGFEDKKPLLSDPNILLILDLMLLTNSEWNELKNKCDYSVLHYEWLNGDTLFDTDKCQMINTFDTNGVPFVFSAICTTRLIEKLIENNSEKELSFDLIEVLTNQLKYVFCATAYASVKSKTNKSKNFLSILSVLKTSLTNILETLNVSNRGLITKCGQSLLEKSVEENGVMYQSFCYFIDNSKDNSDELLIDLSFNNLTYNKIITLQKYLTKKGFSCVKSNEILLQSLNSFLCCENFQELGDGIAKLAVLHSCLKHLDSGPEEVSEAIVSIMETFNGLKSSNSGLFYQKDDIEADNILQFYCLIIQIFETIIGKHSKKLNQSHWDFILLVTNSWIQNISRQQEKLVNKLSVNLFATKVFKLVATIAQEFEKWNSSETKDELTVSLISEWNEFHSKYFFNYLFAFYFDFCELQMNFYEEILFNHLSKALVLVPKELFKDMLDNCPKRESLPIQTIGLQNGFNFHLSLAEEKENFLNVFCPLLLKSHLPIALSSHHLILKFIPLLLKDVTQPQLFAEEGEEESPLALPKTLLSLLQQTDQILDTMLSEFSIGCYCVVEPQTDSFTYTFAYLLIWVQIIEIIANMPIESDGNHTLRLQIIKFLDESNLLSRLLNNLFRLMPLSTTDAKILNANLFDQKLTEHSFIKIDEPLEPSHIQRLSCHLYYLILKQLPAFVRQWWRNSDRNTKDVVNEITSNYFSGILSSQELEAVQRADKNYFKNMTVKARVKAGEVVSKYTFEEIIFELLILLPKNYPLGEVDAKPLSRIGVDIKQGNRWQLQLHQFLNFQNGSIIEALKIFKKNLDQKFEGVEECMICFFVIHGNTLKKPQKKCKNCRKHFHSECLFTWFKTSNQNLCPMCRQLWRFY